MKSIHDQLREELTQKAHELFKCMEDKGCIPCFSQGDLPKGECEVSLWDDGTVEVLQSDDEDVDAYPVFEALSDMGFEEDEDEPLEKFNFKGKHKSKKGGLTEAGRKAYNRATGGNLKRPQPEGGKRKKSFCARSAGQMKMHGINCSKTPDKRVCLARRRWKC
jgi:hypothetical protein